MKTFFLTVFPVSILLFLWGFSAAAKEEEDPLMDSAMEIWDKSSGEIDMEGRDVEYAGYNAKGEHFSLFSKAASKIGNQILLEGIDAEMTAPNSGGMYFEGAEGVFYIEERIFYFTKGGNITTSHGIFMSFDKAKVDFNTGEADVVGAACIRTALGKFVTHDVRLKKLGARINLPNGVKLKRQGQC